jgi:hypothetical protein
MKGHKWRNLFARKTLRWLLNQPLNKKFALEMQPNSMAQL